MIVKLQQIVIDENRHRKVFDESKVDELARSIATYGLFHPPVVRCGPDDKFILMAGERRTRAIRKLYEDRISLTGYELGDVPVTMFETLDAITAKEIELEENLRRVDLTWKEVAIATAELHNMRKKADPTWTMSKTTDEIAERGGSIVSPTIVRDRTLLAANLNRPEVASAPSEMQAMKNLARLMEGEFRAAMAAKMEEVKSPHILVNIDSRQGIPQYVQPGSIDVIITDPPYGIDAEDFGIQTVTEVHTYKDNWEVVQFEISEVLAHTTPKCKEQAHLYMFVDFSHWEDIKQMLTRFGWDVWNRPLIWVKNTGYTPKPDYGPRRNYETIMFASRGRKMVTGVYSDVLTYPAVVDKEHAAEKPLSVYRDLLIRSTVPGSLVLDPFCGSGVVFTAANELNLRAIGFEKEPATYVIAKGKL